MSADQPSRRRGRPRLRPNTTDDLPVNEILRIAAAMFAEVGYEKTSFTSIADAVGIQRASLYHYYANKDALLLDIGLPWLNPLAALVEEFDEEIAPGEVKLYRYLRIDLRHIRAAPYDLGRLYHLPDISAGESMAPLWRIVDTIHDAWTRWITAAVADGALRRVDPRLAGSLVEAAYLGVITSDRPAVREDVGNTADDFADLILAGLLADPERLAELRRLALELDGADPILQTEGNRPLPTICRAR